LDERVASLDSQFQQARIEVTRTSQDVQGYVDTIAGRDALTKALKKRLKSEERRRKEVLSGSVPQAQARQPTFAPPVDEEKWVRVDSPQQQTIPQPIMVGTPFTRPRSHYSHVNEGEESSIVEEAQRARNRGWDGKFHPDRMGMSDPDLQTKDGSNTQVDSRGTARYSQ
jgi:hypothetical protein